MKSYLGIFKMSFKGQLQYRFAAISGIFTQIFWGLMLVYLYTAFMGGNAIDGFSIPQMASYVWLGQAFFMLRFPQMPINSDREIVDGNVCYKLVRPLNIYDHWLAQAIGEKLSIVSLRFLPILILSAFLPENIGLMAPVSLSAALLTIVALLIGLLLTCSLSMLAVYLCFKTMTSKGSSFIVQVITGLLGGAFIPLPLMTQNVQNVLNYLPFRYITDLPCRIYIGATDIKTALFQLLIALAWLVIIIAVGRLLVNKRTKNVAIQGG